jgi:predicted N-acetyltransferase YhbS
MTTAISHHPKSSRSSEISLRPPTPDDARAVAQLVYDAFESIQERHRFARDFPNVETAVGFMHAWIAHPKVWGVLAERDGNIVGCNFLAERNEIRGVGPVCVSPTEQGGGVGRKTMEAVMHRARETNARTVRLVQESYNTASMSLYASLGFDVKEPLAVMTGTPIGRPSSSATARPMTEADLPACAELCRATHQFDRTGELRDALAGPFTPFVLERGGAGRVVAYASAPSFFLLNHGVSATPADMRDLLLGYSAATGQPIGLQVPTRNTDFFRWCLSQKLRMLKPTTLMSTGEYHEPPVGAWWYPSIEY